jgi:mannose-6-phosphate isomerase-like protein (cupin superfamily)
MRKLADAGRFRSPDADGANDFTQQLVVPDLSIGTYSIPAGGVDDQSPHTEDEIYVVTTGRARFVTPDESVDIEPGDVLYVPAAEAHRFVDVTEDLALLVVFAPAYQSRA